MATRGRAKNERTSTQYGPQQNGEATHTIVTDHAETYRFGNYDACPGYVMSDHSGTSFKERLARIEQLVETGVAAWDIPEIFRLITGPVLSETEAVEIVNSGPVHMLKVAEEHRVLLFLWQSFDRTVLSGVPAFAIPLRRILAQHLFKRVGRSLIVEHNVRLSQPWNIELGDECFLCRDVYLDGQGGIEIGDACLVAEGTVILTHLHAEADHSERTLGKVVMEDFSEIYSQAMIQPGVRIGRQAIVANRALVTRDVPPNAVVMGVPAKVIRNRRTEGRSGWDLRHIWYPNGAFQTSP